MLHLLEEWDGTAGSGAQLCAALAEHERAVRASRGRGDRNQVARAEAEVRAAPAERIRFDRTGSATLDTSARRYRAGRFSTPRISELRVLAAQKQQPASTEKARSGRLRLFVFDGMAANADIGALQATAPPETLFQVASQFNCLESPHAYVTEVAHYFHDPTQGPRASVSAFPGTLLRHYAAPGGDGTRFVQSTTGQQINLLADLCPPKIARVDSGYLLSKNVRDKPALARFIAERFSKIRVGLHENIEVVLGYDWDGAVNGERTVTQVLTSTIAGGGYGGIGSDPDSLAICRGLQRAAYLGTLLAAAALGKRYAVLTLIGGGVFGNPIPIIWDAILWAAEEVAKLLHSDLLVAVNGRTLSDSIPASVLAATAAQRGGAYLRLGENRNTLHTV